MNKEQAKELRKPFPAGVVGKIPRGGIDLDYVGHAAVTDRLLEVDPSWTWQPMAQSEFGMPLLDDNGGLWINLTVLGVTRPGYGDKGRSTGANAVKEAIGDALRNAAMRFGVALDLWTKDELESTLADPTQKNEKPTQATPKKYVLPLSTDQVVELLDIIKAKGIEDKNEGINLINLTLGSKNFAMLPAANFAIYKKQIQDVNVSKNLKEPFSG